MRVFTEKEGKKSWNEMRYFNPSRAHPLLLFFEANYPRTIPPKKAYNGAKGNGVDQMALTQELRPIFLFCFFQILEPTTEIQDSGGIHNTTLNIGPPAQYIQGGRYICLANNPEGHAHKEIFVKVLNPAASTASVASKDSANQHSYYGSRGSMPGKQSALLYIVHFSMAIHEYQGIKMG